MINRYGDKWSYEWRSRYSEHRGGGYPAPGNFYNAQITALRELAASRGITYTSEDQCLFPDRPDYKRTFLQEELSLVAEGRWHNADCPTYLLSSACMAALVKTNIVGIRMDDFRPPFDSFQVVLPDGLFVDTPVLMVSHFDNSHHGQVSIVVDTQNHQWLDVLPGSGYAGATGSCSQFSWRTDADVHMRAMEDWENISSHGHSTNGWEYNRMVHIGFSVMLLATHSHDELFAPLLLNRDEEKAKDATPEQLKTYVARAERLHKRKAWVVGKHLVCPTIRKNDKDDGNPTGRTLHYQHWRAGHFHRVRYGEGHEKIRVKWFRPTLVRPDLPECVGKKRIYEVKPANA